MLLVLYTVFEPLSQKQEKLIQVPCYYTFMLFFDCQLKTLFEQAALVYTKTL